ncbi:MAG: DUF4149 domain-containing protein [Helicobacteraceae bacterium]|jgi:hypothetical protein|nr:DUF4149 domain-containing protein [Helicobacteraceae bacterium]
MNRIFWIDVIYTVLLGALFGAAIALGALVAPVIFRASVYMEIAVDVYQSGKLMSEIFRRFNYALIAALIVITAYECWRWYVRESGVGFLLAALSAVISGGVFAFYCTPFILSAARSDDIEVLSSPSFHSVHSLSEALFKVFVLALLTLFALNLRRLAKR